LLAELDLSGCGLSPLVARALTDAGRGGFDAVPRLAVLRLRGNALGDAGASALSRAVWRGALPLLAMHLVASGVSNSEREMGELIPDLLDVVEDFVASHDAINRTNTDFNSCIRFGHLARNSVA
jgi:hypothetical protein